MAYTTIDDPSAYFQNKTYTGGSGDTAHTFDGNSDMQPDMVWIKNRGQSDNHAVIDSVRGSRKWLGPNVADAEDSNNSAYLVSFDSDGFTTSDTDVVGKNTETYISWNWKAGTTASGTTGGSGTGKSYSYSANTTSGFSVVTYTGNATAGHLIPHGMSKVPRLIHIKSRGDDNGWHSGSIVSASAWNDHGYLHLNNAFGTDANQFGATPDATNFRLGTGTGTNGNNGTRVALCFADVQGYQKCGSYIGTGSDVFVYTGFKVGWLLVKNADNTNGWLVIDTKRSPGNPQGKYQYADAFSAEGTVTYGEFYSNGFGWKGTGSVAVNQSDETLVYIAIAENPLVTSTGVPALAR